MSSFWVKFCFRISCQIFFLLLLFGKTVCNWTMVTGNWFWLSCETYVNVFSKIVSIWRDLPTERKESWRHEIFQSWIPVFSLFFLSFSIFLSIYNDIWCSVFLALETFCERGVKSLRLTCRPFDHFLCTGVHQPRFASFNIVEKFASVLLQVPTPECLSFRLRNIPASIIAQQWC